MAKLSKVTKGSKLIADGNWQEGLSILWSEIDSGNEDARVELANTFDVNGLHSFSQDHWMYLLENASAKTLRESGAQGIAQNFLWMRDYGAALAVTEPFGGLQWFRDQIQEKKAEDALFDLEFFSEGASQILGEEQEMLWTLEEAFDRENQLSLIEIRDVVGTMSTFLTRINSPSHENVAVITPLGVSRTAVEALPQAEVAWYQMAHACALLIGDFADDDGFGEDEVFESACRFGRIALGKMFLLRENHVLTNDDEKYVVANIAAGLQNIGSFAGFIYAGLISE
jgi:hypothetical protein